MKRIELLRGLLLAAGWALVACGGVSAIGQGDDELKVPQQTGGGYDGPVPMAPVGGTQSSSTAGRSSGGPTGVGGTASTAGSAPEAGSASEAGGAPSAGGTSSVGSPFTAGSSSTAGSGPTGQRCAVTADCPTYGSVCQACEDGSYACKGNVCRSGRCVPIAETCSAPCQYDMECAVLDAECLLACGNGTYACPVGQCVAGSCQSIQSACGELESCQDLWCGAMCQYCPGGDCATAVAGYCSGNGLCQQGEPQCGSGQ